MYAFATPIAFGCAPRRDAPLCQRRTVRLSLAEPAAPTPGATLPTIDVDALVVGAGVSGTSLAHNLSQQGVSLLLTEARERVGGNVISRQENGYVWEEGPNTFQPAAHIMRLAVDVGLRDELVLADHRLPRFVFWEDKLFALPMGPRDIPTFRLLSLPGAIRAGLGAAGFVLPNFSGKEETIREFVTRHLGAEVFRKMIDPFVSGIYAGDPNALSMSAALKKIFALEQLGPTSGIVEGAIFRLRQRKKEDAANFDPELPTWKGGALGSFRSGLSALPNAIARRLGDDVRLQWRMTALSRREDGRYVATYDTPDGVTQVVAKSVALTTPARATANILADIAPNARELDKIPYPCVWSVTLAYPKTEFAKPLSGFGNLIPRSMGIRTLGTIWSSCLFPGRAPDGMELLLSYIGGAQDPGIADLSEDEVVRQVDADIKKILLRAGADVAPVVVGVRRWERAIPQYNLGYFDIIDKLDQDLQNLPGVFLGGNHMSGVAFGDCVLWGKDTAPKIAQFVAAQAPK